MSIIDKALQDIHGTSSEVGAIALVEKYIDWLEKLICEIQHVEDVRKFFENNIKELTSDTYR